MDKKKVKDKLDKIQRTLESLRGYNDRINKLVLILDDCVESAQKELSKSDWVSVEDRQPPKNAVVQVCNKQNPNDLVLAYRTNQETMKIVYPSNVALYSITHWQSIEKLEE